MYYIYIYIIYICILYIHLPMVLKIKNEKTNIQHFDYSLLQEVTESIYDFSTLYTTIPHNLLVKVRSEVINFILNTFCFVLK